MVNSLHVLGSASSLSLEDRGNRYLEWEKLMEGSATRGFAEFTKCLGILALADLIERCLVAAKLVANDPKGLTRRWKGSWFKADCVPFCRGAIMLIPSRDGFPLEVRVYFARDFICST